MSEDARIAKLGTDVEGLQKEMVAAVLAAADMTNGGGGVGEIS